MDTGQKIAIVGGGAWGLSAALALGEAGHGQVTVFDRNEPGTGATSRAGGLISTHLRLEADIRLVLETERRLEALRQWGRTQALPSAEHAFNPVGGLTVMPVRDASKLDALAERVKRAGGVCERIQGDDLSQRWPLQSTKHLAGLFTPNDGHVEAGDVVDLLQARIKDVDGSVRAGSPADLAIENGTCVGVTTPKGPERFDQVLLAAGSWAKAIAKRAGLVLPLKPYRTQIAQLEFPHAPDFPIFHDTEQYVYSRPDGPNRMLAGDGTEFVESDPEHFNAAPDRPFLEKIARAVSKRWKKGEEARYRTGWAGLCVAVPDRNPIIGPHPTVKRLQLMVGDNGFGLMRCLALGAVAAARVQGRMVPGADTYAPKRLDFQKDFEIREGFEL